MALIPEHLIDRIRESIDIVEVISRYISLRKQGRNYIALCPFHTEKTPSFTVSPEKQIFYCFGCHTGGNVFNFLMHYEKISFIEAVKKLADETGIELPRPESRDSLVTSEYDYLYRANQFAADFYHQMLDKHYNEIENYLSSRDLKESTLKFFKIGYAPTKWDLLYQEILQKKLNLSPFLKCGLIIESEKDSSRKFDRFRNRLLFPIHNLSGRIIAFGGRTLSNDPQTPKYINSPESAIYKKSQVLYGLYYSKEWIRQEEFAIFVEGYMDFLQLFQNGIKNVVATSGTALTEEHAKLIRRYTKKVVLCYDADSAGITAALRGGQVLFQNDIEVNVLILPENEDPDSFVRKNGSSAFYQLVKESTDYFTFKLNKLSENQQENNVSSQTSIVNELLESLAVHPDPIKRNFYINILANRFSLKEDLLLEELKKKQKIISNREKRSLLHESNTHREKRSTIALTGAWSAEKDVLHLLFSNADKIKTLIFKYLEPEDFQNDIFREIFKEIQKHPDKSGKELLHLALSKIQDDRISGLIASDMLVEIKHPAKYLNDCIHKMKLARYQTKLRHLQEAMKKEDPQNPHYNTILQEINETLIQLQNIDRIFRKS